MEGIAGPVSHIVQELVVFQNNVRVFILVFCGVAEIWVFNVEHTTCRSYIIPKVIVVENNGALVALDDKRGHILKGLDKEVVVPLFVWVDHVV